MIRACLAALVLIFSSQTTAQTWFKASELKTLRKATAEDHALIKKELGSAQAYYNFEDGDFYVHDGDLRIDGNFDCDTTVVVNGNLTVSGLYDDYPSGVMAVRGAMTAQQLYSWGALLVEKDLNVQGLALAVYNDFTFEVLGKVNARGLVVSDKGGDHTLGKVNAYINNDGEGVENAVVHFLPELFSRPDHFDGEPDDFYGLSFDDSYAKELMSQSAPLFRKEPAYATLYTDVEAVMDSDINDAELLSFAKKDPLLAQLVASRTNISASLATQLIAFNDGTVNAWLANTHPQLLREQNAPLSANLADKLARNPSTTLDAIADMVKHSDPTVRAKAALYESLVDTSEGQALVRKLWTDTDARVRSDALEAFAFATGFGFVIDDVLISRLINDSDINVRIAASGLALDAAQTRALLAKLDGQGRKELARELQDQALHMRPTRLNRAELSAIATEFFAIDSIDYDAITAATAAYLALTPAEQVQQFDALVERKLLNLETLASDSPSAEVMRKLSAYALSVAKMLPGDLAENPFIPIDLQMKIVELARTAKPKSKDDYGDHPIDALADLLGNDKVSAAAYLAATEFAIQQGLNPSDGSYQNALFHQRNLPPEALTLLDKKLRGDDDWALTLLLQTHANVAQRVRALKQWYDDNDELQASLQDAEDLSESAFYQRAVESKSQNLQEVAVSNPHLPYELVKRLQRSAFPDIRRFANAHPQVPLANLDMSQFDSEDSLNFGAREHPNDWLAIGKQLKSLRARAAAQRKYGEAIRRAAP